MQSLRRRAAVCEAVPPACCSRFSELKPAPIYQCGPQRGDGPRRAGGARIIGALTAALATTLVLATRPAVALDAKARITQYRHSAWRVQEGAFESDPSA